MDLGFGRRSAAAAAAAAAGALGAGWLLWRRSKCSYVCIWTWGISKDLARFLLEVLENIGNVLEHKLSINEVKLTPKSHSGTILCYHSGKTTNATYPIVFHIFYS